MTVEIADFFEFAPAASTLDDLETPVPVIDIDIVADNIRKWQTACDKTGLANRPHIKTHKLVPLAKFQIATGAKGVTVQKLGEAEVMADAGITDLFLTFNIIGRRKLERLAALARRTTIRVVADSPTVVAGLATAGKLPGQEIPVLVECDTGARRNGVQSPEAAADLARLIAQTEGTRYAGLMTYPAPGTRTTSAAFLAAARDQAARSGLESETVSTGGSPDMWSTDGLDIATEYRAGTYVYFDRSLIDRGTCRAADCALTVLSTIVSVPTDDRAVIDAGSKALTSDLLGMDGYGGIPTLPGARIAALSEEHGHVDIGDVARKPAVGDLARVLPNHACPISNLFDKVVFIRGETVLGAVPVDARGMVQ